MTPADLATARREATEALAQADACTCSNDDCDQKRSCFGLCLDALRSLLAATEPAQNPIAGGGDTSTHYYRVTWIDKDGNEIQRSETEEKP